MREHDVRHRPLPLRHVRPGGWLAERIDRAYVALDNLAGTLWWDVTAVWGWEHPARWLRNMTLFAGLRGEEHPLVDEVAERLVATAADPRCAIDYTRSHIGPYSDGELLMGLLARYEATEDRRFLDAAAGLGRKLGEQFRQTPHYYKAIPIAYLVRLSERTGDRSFLEIAEEIAGEQGLLTLRVPAAHAAAAGMILCGYLRLYEATLNPRYLDWVMQGWAAFRERMMVTGGIGEHLCFGAPASESDLHDEACQTAWWFILNLDLGRVTGRAEYYDMAERVLLNHLLFHQIHRGDGGFHACGDIDQGFRGDHNYYCCDNEGAYGLLRALGDMYTVAEDGRAVRVNLYADSEARVALRDGAAVTLRQSTPYPRRGSVRLQVEAAAPTSFALQLRVPGWARHATLRVGGEIVPAVRDAGSWLTVTRRWEGQTEVELRFPMATRVEADSSGKGAIAAPVVLDGRSVEARRVGVLYGPVVQAVFRVGHAMDVSWVWTGDYTEVLDTGGSASEGFAGSRPDYLKAGGALLHTGRVPEDIRISSNEAVPRLTWVSRLGADVQIESEVRVLPGLPVTIERKQTIRGWDGKGDLLCGGIRFALVKSHRNFRYGREVMKWPYPAPVLVTKPDMSECGGLPFQHGTFGLTEPLVDGEPVRQTGVVYLNNGFFRAVCLYDPKRVARVECRRTDEWVGVYFAPLQPAGGPVVLTQRLVYPLFEHPENQTTVLRRCERMAGATARIGPEGADGTTVEIAGAPIRDAVIRAPRQPSLSPGAIYVSDAMESEVLAWDDDQVVLRTDVPARGRLIQPAR